MRAATPGQEASDPARTLVVDDRLEVRLLVERTLGDRHRCEAAGDVPEARERLVAHEFELVFCDIQMPGESGLALVEEIAAKHPDTAVVMLTGVDDPVTAERAFRLGAHGYLVKPFWPGQLRIAALNAMRRHELEIAERRRQEALLGSAEEKAEALRHELIRSQRSTLLRLRESRQETVERLSTALGARDASTGGHINRMAVIAAFLASRMGFDGDRVLLLRSAAPMHDVGKIGTPESILKKPGPLSPAERAEMQRHTTIGHAILADSKSELLQLAATIALTHHERWDGNGYPQGLSGTEIPIEGRIVAVADVFDALLSDRVYRKAMPVEEAVGLMEEGRGTQFDPDVLDILLAHLDEALSLRR